MKRKKPNINTLICFLSHLSNQNKIAECVGLSIYRKECFGMERGWIADEHFSTRHLTLTV
jgi:hypothetical protein